MRYWSFIVFLATLLPLSQASAQPTDDFDPTGHWSGAIIEGNAVFPVELEIIRTGEGLRAQTRFPDWIFYRPSTPEVVRRSEDGLVIEDLLEGDAVLELEPQYEQLFGTVGEDGRRIHLKRALPRPEPLIISLDTSFTSADGTRIAGTLTLPEFGEAHAGMVMVRGRGCAARVNGRSRLFAQYGIAVLTYDKRGAGQSEGDCATFTFAELTDDAIAAHGFLASHPKVDEERVGFFGESAGAWTIQAASERLKTSPGLPQPAFLVTWIGPATSILQQQVSSAATYGAAIGLSEERQEILAEVSRIIADPALSDDAAFARLDAIRRAASGEGWLDQGFGPDDIPRVRTDMPNLWLRRFRYDPAAFLRGLGDLPYLAVFGAKDPIVPVAENVAALRSAGSGVEIAVLDESGHGYDFDERSATLPSGRDVTLFEGPDLGFTARTIAFLRERGFMTR